MENLMSTRGDCDGDTIVLAGATRPAGTATLTALVRPLHDRCSARSGHA